MTSDITFDPGIMLIQAKGNNARAQGALLELYRNYLTVLARLHMGPRLRGKVDAADLVQETFLKAHRDFAQFRGQSEGEFLGWLRRILTASLNMALRHFCGAKCRDVALERSLVHNLDHSSRILDGGLIAKDSSPSQKAARREQAVLLADALEQLPADYREVILCRHMEGLGFGEVAERMNRSVDSVKKLWARGLVHLRRAMGNSR